MRVDFLFKQGEGLVVLLTFHQFRKGFHQQGMLNREQPGRKFSRSFSGHDRQFTLGDHRPRIVVRVDVMYCRAGQRVATGNHRFVDVNPDVRVEGLDKVQIIYDFSKDMSGTGIGTRFDFITVGANGSLRQCPIDFIVP